jgi:O-antigen/teichoic acid export membrane protein
MPLLQKIKTFLFKNQSLYQTITKNTFWLMAGQLVSRLLRASIVIYAARVLGVSSWGAFSYAIGIAASLTILSDFGLNALITKETSREPNLRKKYLATALFIKTALIAILVTLLMIFSSHLTNIEEVKKLIPIIVIVFAFDGLRNLGSALARSMEKMEIEAGIGIFTNLAIVVLGFLFLRVSQTSQSLAYAYALGSGIGLVAIFFALRKYFSGLLKNFTKSLIMPILTKAWPFGLMGLMGVVMLNTDIIMLGWLVSPEGVGFYSAAQKPIQLLYVLPMLLASSVFPIMARLAKSDPVAIKKILEKYVALVILVAIPIALTGFLFAKPIIGIVFGSSYLPAVATFRILILTVLIVYPSTLIGNAIFAYDQHKAFLKFTLVAIVGNVIFNALLIPPLGIEGAAFATLFAQIITNVLIWRKMKKINDFRMWPAIKKGLGFRV